MKVEAAVVTQKRQNSAYNTDNVNINGKVLSHEVIQNGYKGTGVMNDTVFFAVSSSDIEGFADAAVAAFNERSESFNDPFNSPSDIITGYFKDSVYALGEMGHRSSDLASSILYASGNTVIMAKTGNTQLYTFSVNGLAKVTPALFSNEDGSSQYGICTFPTTIVGDIYLLVSSGVSQSLTEKELDDICKASEGSVKKIVNLISKVASAKEGSGGVSAIAVKVTEVDNQQQSQVFGFAPQKITDETPENRFPSFVVPDLTEDDHRNDSSNKNHNLKIAVLAAAIIIVLLGSAALALHLFGGNVFALFNKEKETTTIAVVTTTNPPVTTTKRAETTTNPVTTTMPVTTTVPETTTAKPSSSSSSSSGSRSTTSSRRDDDDEDEEENTTAPQEDEGTTAEPTSEEPTTSPIPSELSPIETEAPSSEASSSINSTSEVTEYF